MQISTRANSYMSPLPCVSQFHHTWPTMNLLCIQRSKISYQRGCGLIAMYQLITAIKMRCDHDFIRQFQGMVGFFIGQTEWTHTLTHRSWGSVVLKPFANGLLAIFSWVIWERKRGFQYAVWREWVKQSEVRGFLPCGSDRRWQPWSESQGRKKSRSSCMHSFDCWELDPRTPRGSVVGSGALSSVSSGMGGLEKTS